MQVSALKALFSKRESFFSCDWAHWDLDPLGPGPSWLTLTRGAIPRAKRIGRLMRWHFDNFVLLKQAVRL
jgi:hypothetical protein